MKILFLKLLVLISSIAYCQNLNLKVSYKVYCDTEIPLIFDSSLWANNDIAIYKERYSTSQRWEERPTDVQNAKVTKPIDVFEPLIKTDRINKEMYFFASIFRNKFLVKDNYIDLKWNIGAETKQIAGYSCTKAETNFRGRKWIVWFATDIPLPFGPWKLHGLPGLILEAFDADKRYTIKVEKIEKSNDTILKEDFKTLIISKNKEAITYQKLLQDQEEALSNLDKQLTTISDMKTTSEKVPRSSEELIYEWE